LLEDLEVNAIRVGSFKETRLIWEGFEDTTNLIWLQRIVDKWLIFVLGGWLFCYDSGS
jgi:hypothetical protein